MTNAKAWFNKSLCPRKPEGLLGRTAQDGHLDSHTAPELWRFRNLQRLIFNRTRKKTQRKQLIKNCHLVWCFYSNRKLSCYSIPPNRAIGASSVRFPFKCTLHCSYGKLALTQKRNFLSFHIAFVHAYADNNKNENACYHVISHFMYCSCLTQGI